jgi:hypothetical protein
MGIRPPFFKVASDLSIEYSLLKATSRSKRGILPKEKGHFGLKSGLSEIWLHRVDDFRNCFLYENMLETNPQFQAVELVIARM